MKLGQMIEIAQALNSEAPREVNREYVRGQAELICELAGLSISENQGWVMEDIAAGSTSIPFDPASVTVR